MKTRERATIRLHSLSYSYAVCEEKSYSRVENAWRDITSVYPCKRVYFLASIKFFAALIVISNRRQNTVTYRFADSRCVCSRSASHVYDCRLHIMIVILFYAILVSNIILTQEYVLASVKQSGTYTMTILARTD